MAMKAMNHEERLQKLISTHLPENRNQWAHEYQSQRRAVIGVMDTLVPEEIIHAFGMLPYRVVGSYKSSTPLAESWRPPQMCHYIHRVVESLLTGELDVLSGMIHSDWDDDERRLYDLAAHLNKQRENFFLHMPHCDGELAYQYFSVDLRRLVREIESAFNVSMENRGLRKSIELYNRMRGLLIQLYEMRKRDVPPVSGSEALGIVMAAFFMPKETYVSELISLIPYLEKRKLANRHMSPRLLIISDRMDLLDYLELVESEGALVVMDDMDSGSRYFGGMTSGNGDPFYALAKRYVSSPAEPCKWHFDRQMRQIIEWAQEYRVDGVIILPHLGDTDRLCCVPFMLESFKRVGIPAMSFTRHYHMANEGQLRTRVRAFLETLE